MIDWPLTPPTQLTLIISLLAAICACLVHWLHLAVPRSKLGFVVLLLSYLVLLAGNVSWTVGLVRSGTNHELGVDRVHRGLDDGTNGWNCEHPIYELVEVRLDRGECLNDSFAGIWRQLVEQASQLIKFGGGFGDSRNSGLRGCFVLDARQ